MKKIKRLVAGSIAGVGLAALAVAPALAQQGLDEPFQASFKKALQGKTVGYLPVVLRQGGAVPDEFRELAEHEL